MWLHMYFPLFSILISSSETEHESIPPPILPTMTVLLAAAKMKSKHFVSNVALDNFG